MQIFLANYTLNFYIQIFLYFHLCLCNFTYKLVKNILSKCIQNIFLKYFMKLQLFPKSLLYLYGHISRFKVIKIHIFRQIIKLKKQLKDKI